MCVALSCNSVAHKAFLAPVEQEAKCPLAGAWLVTQWIGRRTKDQTSLTQRTDPHRGGSQRPHNLSVANRMTCTLETVRKSHPASSLKREMESLQQLTLLKFTKNKNAFRFTSHLTL